MAFPTFADWAASYGKVYNGDEASIREFIYKSNIAKIQAHNEQASSWKMGINQFADLRAEEFATQYVSGLIGMPILNDTNDDDDYEHGRVGAPPPDAIDWVARGAVNPVKDQGSCGSCWDFSAVGALESALQISTGKLVNLAEQQVLDCSNALDCRGGEPEYAYMYYQKGGVDAKGHWQGAPGLCTTASYKYKEQRGMCQDTTCDFAFPAGKVTGLTRVKGKNKRKALMSTIAQQPVSVTVYVDVAQWQLYASGVFTGDCPSGATTNHAVVAVGYGTEGMDYWKIRNSWAADWGESGYIRLSRNSSVQAGTACVLSEKGIVPKLSTAASLVV